MGGSTLTGKDVSEKEPISPEKEILTRAERVSLVVTVADLFTLPLVDE